MVLFLFASRLQGETRSPWAKTRLLESGAWLLGSEKPGATPSAAPAKAPAPRPLLRSRSADELVTRARALEEQGKFREALKEYESALRLHGGHEEAMLGLASILVDQEFDVDRGMREARAALERRPNSAALHDLLGWGYYKKGQAAKARESFQRALGLDDVQVSANYHLGVLRMKEGKLGKALELFRKVTGLDPGHAKAHLSLGLCYRRLGERHRACEAFDKAYGALRGQNAGLAKEIRKLVRQVDSTYVLKGIAPPRRLHPALERRSKPSVPPSDTLVSAAREATKPRGSEDHAAADEGSLPEGDSLLRPQGPGKTLLPQMDLAAPEARPSKVDETRFTRSMLRRDLVKGHLRLGKLYQDYRLYGDARSEFQTVANLDPSAPEARTARTLLQRIEDEPAGTKVERIEGYRELGAFLYQNHDHENARVQYQKILLLDEGDWAARKSIAFLLARIERYDEAERELEKALALRPDFPEALLVLGYVRARQRRFREAASCFADALAMAPPQSRSRRYAEAMLEKMKRFTDLQ